jgi:hypothetical protein
MPNRASTLIGGLAAGFGALMGMANGLLFLVAVERHIGIGLVTLFRAGPENPHHDADKNQRSNDEESVLRNEIDDGIHLDLLGLGCNLMPVAFKPSASTSCTSH